MESDAGTLSKSCRCKRFKFALRDDLRSLAILLVALSSSGVAAEKVDPSGTWRWAVRDSDRQDELRLQINQAGKLDGELLGAERAVRIQDGNLVGDNLTVTFKLDFQGSPLSLRFSGRLKGDEMIGGVTATFAGETREYPWRARRTVSLNDVVGDWKLQANGDGISLASKLRVSKEKAGFKLAYIAEDGSISPIDSLRVDPQCLLRFSVESVYRGSPIKLNFAGRPYGDKISGKLRYSIAGKAGELPIVANREKTFE